MCSFAASGKKISLESWPVARQFRGQPKHCPQGRAQRVPTTPGSSTAHTFSPCPDDRRARLAVRGNSAGQEFPASQIRTLPPVSHKVRDHAAAGTFNSGFAPWRSLLAAGTLRHR